MIYAVAFPVAGFMTVNNHVAMKGKLLTFMCTRTHFTGMVLFLHNTVDIFLLNFVIRTICYETQCWHGKNVRFYEEFTRLLEITVLCLELVLPINQSP